MTKTERSAPDRGDEYVDLTIPMRRPDDKSVLIGVNGEFIRVRPGETVRVKRRFAEVWENSERQARAAWETQTRAQNASRRALAEM